MILAHHLGLDSNDSHERDATFAHAKACEVRIDRGVRKQTQMMS